MGLLSMLPIPDMVQGAYVGFGDKLHPLVNPSTSKLGALQDENWIPGKVDLHVPEYKGEHWIPLSKQAVFHCPKKGILISGPICSALKVNVKSNWVEVFGNGGGIMGGAMNILDMLTDVTTLSTGTSFRQPWMSRKNWKGTDPLHFSIDVNFVNTDTDLSYAYRKMLQMLALVYPMKTSDSSGIDNSEKEHATNDSTSFTGQLKNVSALLKQAGKTVSKMLTGDKYIIPGPAIGHESDKEGSKTSEPAGTPVIVYLGNYGKFRSCYIEQISIECSRSLNMLGYPHYVKCSVEFSQADMSYVENGTFMFGQSLDDNEMSNLVDVVSEFTSSMVQGVTDGFANVADSIMMKES